MRNYDIDIIEPAAMTEAELDRFETNLREVMLYIKYSTDKQKLEEILETDASFQAVDRKAVAVINAVTGGDLKIKEGEEKIDMCQAMREIKADSEAIGAAKGKAEGKAEGRAEERLSVAGKMLAMGMAYDVIEEISGLPLSEIERLAAKRNSAISDAP